MIGQLAQAGWPLVEDPALAHTIVVNTCSFIEDAADESIDAILDMAGYKSDGACKRLIVTGCLPERYRTDIVASLPEVDLFLGTGAYGEIVEAVTRPITTGECRLPDPDTVDMRPAANLRQVTPSRSVYIKVAEGCSRHCTYCIIPTLRGRHKSRPVTDILQEAETLAAAGAREITLVAQDTTAYGHDLASPVGFDALLHQLAEACPDVWIRFLYGHPESIVPSVFDTVAAHPNICPYFDLPIQHASPDVLRRMGRHYDDAALMALCDQIRHAVPEAALRTTVIVGFPGETRKDMTILANTIERIGFDHLGVFTYSDADDLPSHRLNGHVPASTARRRHDRIMSLQMDISLARNRSRVGTVCDALVESRGDDGLVVARTQYQAPEVDGVTFVRNSDTAPGQRFPVRIIDALDYDLVGEPA